MPSTMIGPDGELLINEPHPVRQRHWGLRIFIALLVLVLFGAFGISAYHYHFYLYSARMIDSWGNPESVCGDWTISGFAHVVDYMDFHVRAWTDDGLVLHSGIYENTAYTLAVPKQDGVIALHVALMDRNRQRSQTANVNFGVDGTCEIAVDFQ